MKRSFSLIETLASIILLSIIISGFLNLSVEGINFLNHINLQSIKNQIASNEFSSFSKNKIDIDFNIQDNSTLNYNNGTTYSKYIYSSQFKLIYNDIPFKETTLNSKVFE